MRFAQPKFKSDVKSAFVIVPSRMCVVLIAEDAIYVAFIELAGRLPNLNCPVMFASPTTLRVCCGVVVFIPTLPELESTNRVPSFTVRLPLTIALVPTHKFLYLFELFPMSNWLSTGLFFTPLWLLRLF